MPRLAERRFQGEALAGFATFCKRASGAKTSISAMSKLLFYRPEGSLKRKTRAALWARTFTESEDVSNGC